MDPAELTQNLFTGLVDLMRELSKARPLVLLLDDIDAADEATLEMISRCLPEESRVLFIGAARTRSESELEESAPWTAFVEALGEHSNQFLIQLEPLGAEATTE